MKKKLAPFIGLVLLIGIVCLWHPFERRLIQHVLKNLSLNVASYHSYEHERPFRVVFHGLTISHDLAEIQVERSTVRWGLGLWPPRLKLDATLTPIKVKPNKWLPEIAFQTGDFSYDLGFTREYIEWTNWRSREATFEGSAVLDRSALVELDMHARLRTELITRVVSDDFLEGKEWVTLGVQIRSSSVNVMIDEKPYFKSSFHLRR